MSLETAARLFAKKNGISLQESADGFFFEQNTRLWMQYNNEHGEEYLICGKLFASSSFDESIVGAYGSSTERELSVEIRFGCLRDYINQLHTSRKPLLIDLRQRLEGRLQQEQAIGPEKLAEEKYTDFGYLDVYRILERFYP